MRKKPIYMDGCIPFESGYDAARFVLRIRGYSPAAIKEHAKGLASCINAVAGKPNRTAYGYTWTREPAEVDE